MTTKKTTIAYNSYAEQWASKMRSGENLAHEYLEKPAMYGKLPSLKDKSALCIGCGTGEECAHLKSLGAKRVIGIDLSSGMIEQAKRAFPDIDFRVVNLEQFDFPANSFDFIYSSLTLHYLKNWEPALAMIHHALKPNGTFLFSTHHPFSWAAERKRVEEKSSNVLGFSELESDVLQVYGDYFTERTIDDIWFGDFEVSFFHKPFSSILKDVVRAGFTIVDCLEPQPLESVKKKDERFWHIHSRIPLFVIFELKKEEK